MKIQKLESRTKWLCKAEGHSYVREEIQWVEGGITIGWFLNEDGTADYEPLSDEQLETLFWQNNVKKNNPVFYSSNTDKHFTPTEKGWYVQYRTESGDEGAIKVDREPTSDEDALEMLKAIMPEELWIVQYYAEVI